MIAPAKTGNTFVEFPFTIELVRFKISRYPGSSSPSSFESEVKIHKNGTSESHLISMNQVLDMEGYRFFQSSYDPDEKGSVLSVNKDIAGRYITYTGYFILILGFTGSLTGKNSRFRQLNRRLKELRMIPVFL